MFTSLTETEVVTYTFVVVVFTFTLVMNVLLGLILRIGWKPIISGVLLLLGGYAFHCIRSKPLLWRRAESTLNQYRGLD